MNKRTIQRATRQRVREVLEAELSTLADFMYSVTRKSVDLTTGNKRETIVHGFSPGEHWDIVEAEAARIYKRLTGKDR